MNHGRHDTRTIRREALASRQLVMVFVALGLIVTAAQLRAEEVAHAQPDPIEVALEFCLNAPENREQLDLLLTDAGWIRHPDAPIETVLSQVWASHWDREFEPHELIGGAVMMAAQINEGYDEAQHGYRLNGHSIAFLNIGRVDGYSPQCYFSGPSDLEDAILSFFEISKPETELGRRTHSWQTNERQSRLDAWEPDTLEDTLSTFPSEFNDEPFFRIKTTNLRII